MTITKKSQKYLRDSNLA